SVIATSGPVSARIVAERRLAAAVPVAVTGKGGPITVLPFLQEHGDISSLGFRFAGLAYSCALSGIPSSSLKALSDLDVWIVDALRYTPHPSHFSVDVALPWLHPINPNPPLLPILNS